MTSSETQEASGPEAEKYLDDGFGQYIESLLDEYHVPGMSVAVVRDGKVESAGYGMARLPDVRATADTLFCMGSTTKAFTAALLGLLIQDAAKDVDDETGPTLTWSTRVKPILGDDLETTDPYVAANMTFEDMLSHRTGIPGHDLIWGPWLKTPADVTRLLRHTKVAEPFRTKMQYNNLTYGAVGHAIDIITGRDYASVLSERVWEPLKMDRTYMGAERASDVLTASKSGDLEFARGYQWIQEEAKGDGEQDDKKGKGGYYVAVPHTSILPLEPAGAIISSVNDYAKWVLELLRASAEPPKDNKDEQESKNDAQSGRIISHDLWKELTTPRSNWLPPPVFNLESTPTTPNMHVNAMSYSLGWLNDPFLYPGENIAQHGGGVPGFGSLVYMAPDRDFGVVVVGNTADKVGQVNEFVVKELLGRRIGKSKEERRKRHGDKTKPPPDSKESPKYNAVDVKFAQDTLKIRNNPSKPDDSETTSSFLLSNQPVSLPKNFTNPAYGGYTVTLAPTSVALSHPNPTNTSSATINRAALQLKNLSPLDSTNNDTPHTISIRPVGPRGLNYELILHPSAVLDDKILYDSEQLIRSGLPDVTKGDHPDPFASLPPGHGNEDDERYPYRDVKVWTAQSLKLNGGVFVLEKEPDGEGLRVGRMGLRLARVDEVKNLKNGVLERGWEDRLEWFVPA